MQTDKEFEDFFREQLNGLEETPPPNAWNKINKDLKPPRTWHRELAALALVLLISIGTYFGYEKLAGKKGQENGTAVQVASSNVQGTKENKTETKTETKTTEIITAQPAADKAIENAQPQTAPEPTSEIAKTTETAQKEPVASVSETALNPETKTAKRKNPVSLNGVLAVVKTNKQTKNTSLTKAKKETNISEVTALNVTKASTNSVAFAPEKRYVKAAKNSGNGNNSAKTNETLARTGTVTNAGTTLISNEQTTKSSETNAENGMISGAETALAQTKTAKTDSVALATIPMPAADSVEKANQELAKTLKPEEKKFAVVLTFTPGIIARRLIANPNDEKYLRFNDSKGNNRANLGYDMSATFQHRISEQTTLDVGLAYTKLHSTVTYKITTNKLDVVTQTNPGGTQTATVKVTTTTAEEEIHNEFTYGGLRVGITQDLGKFANYSFFASTGAGVNTLLQKSGKVSSEATSGNGQTTHSYLEDNAFHNVNSHLYLNAGVKKAIWPGVEMLVAPAFTYYLNSTLRKQQGFELKPYTFGLNLGLRYQF